MLILSKGQTWFPIYWISIKFDMLIVFCYMEEVYSDSITIGAVSKPCK